MYTLSHFWLLLLIPLPVILNRIIPPYRESRQAIRVPWFERMAALFGGKPADGAVITEPKVSERVLGWILWALIVLALAQPQYLFPGLNRRYCEKMALLPMSMKVVIW